MIDGKVYLCPTTGSFSDLIYNQTKNLFDECIVPNTEASHVTVINSNIVYDIGVEKVTEFVSENPKEFCLNFGNIKSTTSNDWSVFSKCYVIEISSEYLSNFITEFNNRFKKSIKPSPHITFAIKLRKLINKC